MTNPFYIVAVFGTPNPDSQLFNATSSAPYRLRRVTVTLEPEKKAKKKGPKP